MSKSKQKRNNYNNDIVNELKLKYGFSYDYILKSIRGERTGTLPIRIQEEYKALDAASKKAIRNNIDNL